MSITHPFLLSFSLIHYSTYPSSAIKKNSLLMLQHFPGNPPTNSISYVLEPDQPVWSSLQTATHIHDITSSWCDIYIPWIILLLLLLLVPWIMLLRVVSLCMHTHKWYRATRVISDIMMWRVCMLVYMIPVCGALDPNDYLNIVLYLHVHHAKCRHWEGGWGGSFFESCIIIM